MSLSRIVLSSGRSIELTEVRMSSTYAGMLEGYPCRRLNELKLNSLRHRTEHAFSGTPVHLVPPVVDRSDPTPGPFGPVETLPAVTCTGLFRSAAVDPALEPVLHRSALVVIWFQATTEPPTTENAAPDLRALPWEDLARDHEL
ncbi:hypothetical protein [Kitasatospora sp. NPDC088134]|uniref:hypothetical protein n=1 Tax=Kitasatospora sp. NPDC088134 TaxID=3364071 RepID=UPI003815A976